MHLQDFWLITILFARRTTAPSQTAHMWVLFFALPCTVFQEMIQEGKIRKDAFGNQSAIILKRSLEDAARAAYEDFRRRSTIGDVSYSIAIITISDEVWEEWENQGLVQETKWLTLPGWRVFTDIILSEGVEVAEIGQDTWRLE